MRGALTDRLGGTWNCGSGLPVACPTGRRPCWASWPGAVGAGSMCVWARAPTWIRRSSRPSSRVCHGTPSALTRRTQTCPTSPAPRRSCVWPHACIRSSPPTTRTQWLPSSIWAGERPFELQRLHDTGEALYDLVLTYLCKPCPACHLFSMSWILVRGRVGHSICETSARGSMSVFSVLPGRWGSPRAL